MLERKFDWVVVYVTRSGIHDIERVSGVNITEVLANLVFCNDVNSIISITRVNFSK